MIDRRQRLKTQAVEHMLTYLIILLDDTSVSYCHYTIGRVKRRLIGINDLRAGILFAMKENLNIYPDYELPDEYKMVIDSIDHIKIGPTSCREDLDIIIVDNLNFDPNDKKSYLWRCTLNGFGLNKDNIANILHKVYRLNVVLTDIPNWKDKELEFYKENLDYLTDKILIHFQRGTPVQLNLITDRFMLGKMNNCNAGNTNVTLAPDGRFYICPAFYSNAHIGSLKDGLEIPNKQLFSIDHAPICLKCDAFQCKRCVWMNQMMTLDCNIPSYQQCVAAHLERNASRKLLSLIKTKGIQLCDVFDIEELDYLDPIINIIKWN